LEGGVHNPAGVINFLSNEDTSWLAAEYLHREDGWDVRRGRAKSLVSPLHPDFRFVLTNKDRNAINLLSNLIVQNIT
jgi:hypothetical protein